MPRCPEPDPPNPPGSAPRRYTPWLSGRTRYESSHPDKSRAYDHCSSKLEGPWDLPRLKLFQEKLMQLHHPALPVSIQGNQGLCGRVRRGATAWVWAGFLREVLAKRHNLGLL